MPKPTKFSPEVRERAVRMVYEVRESHDSQWAAIEAVSSKIGCTAQTLSNWIRKTSSSSSPTPSADPRIKELEREIRELKRANEILKVASAFFGANQSVFIGKAEVRLIHAPPMVMQHVGTKVGAAISALFYLGKDGATPDCLRAIQNALDHEDLIKLLSSRMPAWMRIALAEAQGRTG